MTTYPDNPLTEQDIIELWEERAAIYEHDRGMRRSEAEDAARYWVYGYWSDHQGVFEGWDWSEVQAVLTKARHDR